MIPEHVQQGKNHTDEEIIMYIPVRCFSCGKPIGHLWEKFQEKVSQASSEDGKSSARKKFLDDEGLTRYCCRAAIMTHIDLDDTARFRKF